MSKRKRGERHHTRTGDPDTSKEAGELAQPGLPEREIAVMRLMSDGVIRIDEETHGECLARGYVHKDTSPSSLRHARLNLIDDKKLIYTGEKKKTSRNRNSNMYVLNKDYVEPEPKQLSLKVGRKTAEEATASTSKMVQLLSQVNKS